MKKKIILQISILLLVLVTAATAVFAYFYQKDGGWSQTIHGTTLSFRVNGKSLGTITNESPVVLSKGVYSDFDFTVELSSTTQNSVVAEYDITFSSIGTAEENELARAVEVYRYDKGAYVYQCMLNDFKSITGRMPVNASRTHSYRLIYSSGAGEYYEGKSFAIKVEADYEIKRNAHTDFFVNNYNELVAAADAVSNGSVIFLNSDITVPQNELISLNTETSIDLNGHSLTMGNGARIAVNFNGGGNGAGLFNSSSGTGGIAGGGALEINTPNGIYFIQDDIELSAPSNIDINSFSLSAAVAAMSDAARAIEKSILYAGDTADFAKNLHFYFNNGYLSYTLSAEDSDTLIDMGASGRFGGFGISGDYNIENTVVRNFIVDVSKITETEGVSLTVTICGTGASAVANALIATVPDVINGSLFFPTRFGNTNTVATFISDSEQYIDGNGIYIKDGVVNLPSWQDKNVRIGVITESGGERGYAEKTATVRIMNAQQRTEKVYNFNQIIVEEEGGVLDFRSVFTDNDFSLKAGLKGIVITISGDGSNLDAAGNSYIDITDTDGFGNIVLLNKPNTDITVNVNVSVKFVYENNGNDIEYTLDKAVTVVGYRETTELTDITPVLQGYFRNNEYISNPGIFRFKVKSYTPKGANVDYFVGDAYKNMILIKNDLYTPTPDGSGVFAYIQGKYHFYGSRYNLINGRYEPNVSGEYILVDNTPYNFAELVAAGNISERETEFEILPAKVPSRDIEMPFTAKIWSETDADGNKIYLKSGDSDVEYIVTLAVSGIYHNVDAEIKDYFLYEKLLKHLDANGNGWLEVSEAHNDWQALHSEAVAGTGNTAAFSVVNGTDLLYIDLSELAISSLKGLEYVTGALGFDLSNNNILDLSELSGLFGLKYLNLGYNNVSDVADLSYLDALERLILSNNTVTDISPLRYLPNIGYLDISGNDNLADFSPLTDYRNLTYLNIRQENDANTDNVNVRYYLSLIAAENPGVTILRLMLEGYWTATNEEIVAALALRELMTIDEIYTTLNIPNTYPYNGKVYNIVWETLRAEDANYLRFISDANGYTVGYEIVTPVVDRVLSIGVRVTDTMSGGSTFTMSRNFSVKLLASLPQSDNTYIEVSPGSFVSAAEAVPDANLRSLLFSEFNTVTDGVVSGTAHLNKNVLDFNEINTRIKDTIDFRNSGIKSLEGLRYFAGALSGSGLLLQGNPLTDADISELGKFDGLTGLSLNSQLYDFSTISPADGVGQTSLRTLNVYGSYGLSEEEVLRGLYIVYLRNPNLFNIYKDSSTSIWSPYVELLSKYAMSLPMAFSFSDINETHSYFNVGAKGYTFNFYGVKDIEFTLREPSRNAFNGHFSANFNNVTETYNGQTIVTGVMYNKFGGYDDVVYARIDLSGYDGKATVTATHYTELKVEFNRNLLVTDYNNGEPTTLDVIFPGRSLRTYVTDKLSDIFNSTASASSIDSIGAGYYQEGNRYYVTMATLNSLTHSGEIVIDGSYAYGNNSLSGLQYTSFNRLTINKDANLGNGEFLTNLEYLKIVNSAIDFGSVTTELKNLKSLILGSVNESNRYVLLYGLKDGRTVYYLSNFTNLETLHIVNSNIYDFSGLNGLIDNDTLTYNIKELRIHGTTAEYSNKNNSTSYTVNLVGEIYQRSTATDKHYYIGTEADPNDSITLFTGEFEAATGASSLVTTEAYEYNEFSQNITDVDFKLNGNSYFTDTVKELSGGQTVTLPISTGLFAYKTGYIEGVPRDYVIEWRIIGVGLSRATALISGGVLNAGDDLFGGNVKSVTVWNNGSTGAHLSSNLTLTFNTLADDVYLVFEGTIGSGYFDENGTYIALNGTVPKSFSYPVLVKGSASDGLSSAYIGFGEFTDVSLRHAVFMAMAVSGGIHENGYIIKSVLESVKELSITKSSSSLGAMTVKNTSNTTYNINLGASVQYGNPEGLSRDAFSLYKLGGIEKFIGLKVLNLSGMFISDISALAKLPQELLNTLNLSNNIITDVSALRGFSALQSVNLSYNNIRTVKDADSISLSVFHNSLLSGTLKELNLSYNKNIKPLDVAALANSAMSGAGFAQFSTLDIQNTSCDYEYEVYEALNNIFNAKRESTGTGAQNTVIKVGLLNNANMNAAAINNFVADYNDASGGIYAYLTTGMNSTDVVGTFAVGGRNYTASLTNPYVKDNNRLGGNYVCSMMITAGVSNAFSVIIKVKYIISNATNYTLYAYEGAPTATTAADFDPEVWAYLTAKAAVTAGSDLYFLANAGTVELKLGDGSYNNQNEQRMNIKSLKGLDKLNIFKTIYVRYGKGLSLGFTVDNTVITTLEIRDFIIADGGLSGISHLTNLQTLKMFVSYNADFTATYNGTSLAQELAGLTKLTYIDSNNQYNIDFYNADNVFAATDRFLNAPDEIFGYDKSGSALSTFRVLGSLTGGENPARIFEADGMLTTMRLMENYRNVRKFGGAANRWGGGTPVTNEAAILQTYLLRDIINSEYTSSVQGREVLPSVIYENNINDTGVAYNLPAYFYFLNEKITASYTFYAVDADNLALALIDKGYAVMGRIDADLLSGSVESGYVFSITPELLAEILSAYPLISAIEVRAVFSYPSGWGGVGNVTAKHCSQLKLAGKIEAPTGMTAPYYFEAEDGTLRNAGDVLASGALIEWLFNGYTSPLGAAAFAVAESGGYYMTKEAIAAVTALDIPDKGITSLDGITLFKNLSEISIDKGSVTDIRALAGLKLKTFAYKNPESNADNSIITDFRPLFNSRDTLESFTYAGSSLATVEDLSFLMGFGSQLKEIYVYPDYDNNVDNTYRYGYMYTSAFKYMVSWFAVNRPETAIYTNWYYQYDIGITGVWDGYKGLLRLKPDSGTMSASIVLSSFDSFGSDVSYVNNYQLIVNNATVVSDAYRVKIPAYINHGGESFAIDYRSLSSFVTVSDIIFKGLAGKTYSFTVQGKTLTLKDGDAINKADLQALLDTIEFKNLNFAGETDAVTIIEIRGADKNLSGTALISQRINFRGFDYDRMLSIDIAALPATNYLLHSELSEKDVNAAPIFSIDGAPGTLCSSLRRKTEALYE